MKASDVIVIGAGAAGLSAARRLSGTGRRVLVLEARERPGGRILTHTDAASPAPLDLGAEFIHGTAPETFAIVRAAGLVAQDLPDVQHVSRAGAFRPHARFWDGMAALRKEAAAFLDKRGGDLSVRAYLDRSSLTPEDRLLFGNFIQGFDAADLDVMSARSLGGEGQGSDNRQYRLVGGYEPLVSWLRAGLDPDRAELRLGTVVTEIAWKKGSVRISAVNAAGAPVGPFEARGAVVTLPLALLKAGTPRFDPEPVPILRAAEELEMGQVFKILLRFREAFWEEAAAANVKFLHAPGLDVPTWWTALPSHLPVLTGWAGGPAAEAMLARDETARRARSLDSVAAAFGVSRERVDDALDGVLMHDWRADPFSRGAYAYVRVGGAASPEALSRPVEDTLFFAGEATDAEQMGTVAGAIASGHRAADQVRAAS